MTNLEDDLTLFRLIYFRNHIEDILQKMIHDVIEWKFKDAWKYKAYISNDWLVVGSEYVKSFDIHNYFAAYAVC